ncbi:hypothetical protein H072_4221 [Dactylellina haptotyla CBS 200.50]|uniref:Uncharacterized protein n=1 Tax=Dactylellina haptotyla (strain CBS 200.50) TaxID=1284197 RepID=S8AFM1_DACHA|nr:hypothetical protein H072_4221 [Dactylellina haptotyla CBS 200.50]
MASSAIPKSIPAAGGSVAKTAATPADESVNINNNTSPLTAASEEDPRSIGQQEIGLISRIQEEEEHTYNGDGSLYAADDDQSWNGEPGDGGYKLESDSVSASNPAMSSSFSAGHSYNSFHDMAATTPTITVDETDLNGYDHDGLDSWDHSTHPLTALFNPPEPDPIQRSFTAPATSFPLTLQERRLQLRNSHMRATPMASSVKPEDSHVKGLSRAANALRSKHFTSLGRASTVSSRLSDLTASDDDLLHTTARRNSSNFGSLPSIHASLRHRKTPSVEQSGYIEHLEKQISDLSLKLRSYTDPSSEKSHAAIVQRLNAKVRSLENQVSEWEALFDERIRETERINARERASYSNQIKLLREQIDTLNHNVSNLEEDLDFEKKQNTALTLAVTEKKALAMDNAQLAQALTKALGEIAELEAQAQEREEEMYSSNQAKTLGQLMIDVTPKPRSLETFAELNMATGTTIDVSKNSLFSPMASDAAWQTLSPTTSNASTPDQPLKRKMRKFPSGIAPKQLVLSPSSSRRSSVEFNRGHSRNASSSWGSPKMERISGGRNSLFEELEKLQEDGMVATINDEIVSNVGSHVPAEVSEAEQDHPEHHTSPLTSSPTDTETSDSEDPSPIHTSPQSAQSRASPYSSSSSTRSTPARVGTGIGYVLSSPFRVTSAVITTIGRGVLSPRTTLRDIRQHAMDQLMEVSEIEESFGSDILFGDQYDEHLRSGGQNLTSPELRAQHHNINHNNINGSVRSTGTGLSIDLKDILDNNTDSITTAMSPPGGKGTVHRRGNATTSTSTSTRRRRTSQHAREMVTSDDDMHVVFSGGKRGGGADYMHQGSDPNTPCKPRRKNTKQKEAKDDSAGKPILPVKPRQDIRERLQRKNRTPSGSQQQGLGISDSRLPPPYSEYPDLARRRTKDDGWRTENSAGEISSSTDDERRLSQGIWIPESQLRAFREDFDHGGLLKAMGLSNENGMVLWTKLFFGVMVTMFVALRDGPSVALERVDGTKSAGPTPVKRIGGRRDMGRSVSTG